MQRLSRSKMDGFSYIQTNFKKTDAVGIYGYYYFIEWLDSSCYNVNIQKTGYAIVKVTGQVGHASEQDTAKRQEE